MRLNHERIDNQNHDVDRLDLLIAWLKAVHADLCLTRSIALQIEDVSALLEVDALVLVSIGLLSHLYMLLAFEDLHIKAEAVHRGEDAALVIVAHNVEVLLVIDVKMAVVRVD